jgi:hypothetical protein
MANRQTYRPLAAVRDGSRDPEWIKQLTFRVVEHQLNHPLTVSVARASVKH